jgi:hypothetical protein
MRALSVITLTGCLLSACKPAAPPDKKEEAKQEMQRLEAHREKAVEKATKGTIPKSKPSTFTPVPSVKPAPPSETSAHP